MYQTFTFLHSTVRWLVLLSLTYAVLRACKGYFSDEKFSETDDSVRHWTAMIAYVQLLSGIILYSQSPVISYFWKNFNTAKESFELLFFGLILILLMLSSMVLITVGSSVAKRKTSDRDQFKTVFIWYGVALALIFAAIPWPFSPFANRPYFR